MNDSNLKEFARVLRTFDTAMLVTQRDNELRSRPMAIAGRTESGGVWFITSIDSGKLGEITDNPVVNVAMQASGRFMSISGTTRATRDSTKIDELWDASHGIWFEMGREDPDLILVEVVPTYAEYWDRSGIEGVKFMFAAVSSAVTGATVRDEQLTHGKVEFPTSTGSQTWNRSQDSN